MSSSTVVSSDPAVLSALVAGGFGVKFRTNDTGEAFGEVEPSRALDNAGDPATLVSQLTPKPDSDIERANQLVSSGMASAVTAHRHMVVDAAVRRVQPSISLTNEMGNPEPFLSMARAAKALDADGVKSAGEAADAWLRDARERETQSRKDLRFLRSR